MASAAVYFGIGLMGRQTAKDWETVQALLRATLGSLVNQSDQVLGERFEPPAPTLFEYLRRSFAIPSHQTLILNGEDRTGEEFYTFSNHHEYGIDYRSQVLSLFRFKTWLARKRIAEDDFATPQEKRQTERELAQMKPEAVLINTARGGIVDERALVKALREGRLGGAGIDVLSEEPPVHGNPLLEADIPNLIVTPHVAWASRESRQRLIDAVAENIRAYLMGTPQNLVA